jgi:hypothetical protein
MKSLFLGGRFDGYMGKFSNKDNELSRYLNADEVFNGGNTNVLDNVLDKIQDYGKVFWFADVPGKNGIVKQVKRRNGRAILVNAVRNNGDYSFSEMMQDSLDNRVNLIVETREGKMRVLDPLANMFLDYTHNLKLVGNVLDKRVEELERYTRVESFEVPGNVDVPDEQEFFSIVREYGKRFHEIIHGNLKENRRFLGNASFRCERGFPSFRKGSFVFVSRRNVDKREIDREDFVPVLDNLPVRYHGKNKPSVDSPVQVELYNYYPGVNYMIHGHVYVENARFTDRIVPCGAMEEVDEIRKVYPERENENFAVNLLGHGSIVFVSKPMNFLRFKHTIRRMPEMHSQYLEERNGR